MSLLQRIKRALKRFFPASSRTFQGTMEELRSEHNEFRDQALAWAEEQKKKADEQEREIHDLKESLRRLEGKLEEENRTARARTEEGLHGIETQLTDLRHILQGSDADHRKLAYDLGRQIHEIEDWTRAAQVKLEENEKQQQTIKTDTSIARGYAWNGMRYAREAVWAEIFNNTVQDSPWLKDNAFSPGRWAVGYQFLYVLYRVLNEVRPKRILDLGLGQSSRLISQYAMSDPEVEHQIVEHDPEWISFFEQTYRLPPNSRIVQLDREMIPYREAESVRVFHGFQETFEGQRFDLISVDAPLGGDMKQYSRIDILSILPDGLSEDFVIMVDDYNRTGEKKTVEEIRRVLEENEIEYSTGQYTGEKEMYLICSKKNAFLCSL